MLRIDLDLDFGRNPRPSSLKPRVPGRFETRFDCAHAAAGQMLHSMTFSRKENVRSSVMGPADIVVAVPVRNEADRIATCVRALCQTSAARKVRALFLVNNGTDGTAGWLLDHLETLPMAAEIVQLEVPPARQSAGYARWLANHAAFDLADPIDGMLFMTDADSCVPPDWVERYGQMLERGWDVVAGLVDINRADCDQIVASLDHRNHLEDCYAALIDELETLVDPVAHDPWPRHFTASGANTAARVAAVRRLNDFPSIACGEDRALVRAMEAMDMKVRHDTLTPVHTSGRLFGRAHGGMADTLRHRTQVPDALCDERLERADRAYLRASLRVAWRRLRMDRQPGGTSLERFAADLDVPLRMVTAAAELHVFGASWQALEAASPRLRRRPVAPARLALEIQRAKDLLRIVQQGVRPAWRETGMEMRA